MRSLLWGLLPLSFSIVCHATDDVTGQSTLNSSAEVETNTWVEFGVGTASALNIKRTKDSKGWGISIARYDDVEFLGDGKTDVSGKRIDDGIDEIAILRVQTKTWRWGYSDIAYGLAYQHATLAKNCEKISEGWFGPTYTCVKEEKKGVSIPVEVNVSLGRYAGIGIKLRGTIGSESVVGVALNIPLGDFSK